MEGRQAELEFVTALAGENIEDHMAYLGELPPAPDEHEVSFRLLLYYAASVRHQKYHGIDIVTVHVDGDGQEQQKAVSERYHGARRTGEGE